MWLDAATGLGDEEGRVELIEERDPLLFGIWRVGENEVKCRGARVLRFDPAEDICLNDGCLIRESERVEILVNHFDSVTVAFDEDAARCTAAQRLDTECTRPGVEIANARALCRSEAEQDVEDPVSYTHLTLPTIYSV